MNVFVLVCTIFCIILLLFIAYAFIANKDSAPVSAQQKRLLAKSVNITSSPNESVDNNTDNGWNGLLISKVKEARKNWLKRHSILWASPTYIFPFRLRKCSVEAISSYGSTRLVITWKKPGICTSGSRGRRQIATTEILFSELPSELLDKSGNGP